MFININDNGRRVNPYAQRVLEDGTRCSNLFNFRGKWAANGFVEIPDPARGNDEVEYTTEQDLPPYVVITPKSAEVVLATKIAKYEHALDSHLDNVARLHRYNDRFTFALRAGYVGPYQAEGIAFAQWMDACNVAAYALLQQVIAGTIEAPAPDAFIASLPAFVMPS